MGFYREYPKGIKYAKAAKVFAAKLSL